MIRQYKPGIAAQLYVKADLYTLGHGTLTPDAEFDPYDLAVDVAGRLYKLQVKSTQSNVGGRVKVDIRKPSAKGRTYDSVDYDILAVVDMTTRKIAYLSKAELSYGRQLTLFTEIPDSRVGMPLDYAMLMFADYSDMQRAIDSLVINAKEDVI